MTLSCTKPPLVVARMLAPALSRLVRELTCCEHELGPHALGAAVGSSGIQRVDVTPYLSLQTHGYCHRLVYRSSRVELGCVGWLPGQHTPIHHHAGSSCCVLVLDGVLTNLEFACADQPRVLHKRTLHAGELLLYSGHEFHRMSNDAQHANLFTLHVYSPPLAPMSHRTNRGAKSIVNRRKS